MALKVFNLNLNDPSVEDSGQDKGRAGSSGITPDPYQPSPAMASVCLTSLAADPHHIHQNKKEIAKIFTTY